MVTLIAPTVRDGSKARSEKGEEGELEVGKRGVEAAHYISI